MLFLLCGLVACASNRGPSRGGEVFQPALVETGREWLPGEEEILFRVSDGDELAGRRWQGGASTVDKVIVAVHGVGFYSAVYRDAGKYFSGKGVPVLAFDLRGHGHSTGKEELGHFAGMAVYQRDLRDVILATRQAYPGARIYVVGTSLGANIATLLFTDEGMAPEVSGLTLISPVWLRADLATAPWWWKMLGLFPRLKLGEDTCVATTTDDAGHIKCWLDDPLVLKALSVEYLNKSLELSAKAAEAVQAKGFKAPNLTLVGGCDALVMPEMAYNTFSTLLRDVKEENSRLAYYPCGHHALLAGLSRNAVAGDVLAWLETPGAPLPSKADDRALERFGATTADHAAQATCCINYKGKKPPACLPF
jgi:alpha-beta hydrolase superfamily lysophospholipase